MFVERFKNEANKTISRIRVSFQHKGEMLFKGGSSKLPLEYKRTGN